MPRPDTEPLSTTGAVEGAEAASAAGLTAMRSRAIDELRMAVILLNVPT